MLCPKCGSDNLEDAKLCRSCGQPISATPLTPTDKPKTSKLAIWSLVLGLISIIPCLLVFTAIPSIVCGIIGLVKISKSNGQLKGKGLAITGIVMPFVCVVLLAISISVLYKIKCIAPRIICRTNLSSISKAMLVYTNDHNDTYPSSDKWCDLLIGKANITKDFFVCPGSETFLGKSSYAININTTGKKTSEIPPKMVLIFETNTPGWNMAGGRELVSTENHHGDGCNVLFADGHVKFIKDPNSLRWTAE